MNILVSRLKWTLDGLQSKIKDFKVRTSLLGVDFFKTLTINTSLIR